MADRNGMVTIVIRIPPTWMAALREIADERSTPVRDMPMSEVIREAIYDYLQTHGYDGS